MTTRGASYVTVQFTVGDSVWSSCVAPFAGGMFPYNVGSLFPTSSSPSVMMNGMMFPPRHVDGTTTGAFQIA